MTGNFRRIHLIILPMVITGLLFLHLTSILKSDSAISGLLSNSGDGKHPQNRRNATRMQDQCKNSYRETCGAAYVYEDLGKALEERASPDGVVILAGLLDGGGYLDLGVNFHLTSIARHSICNVIYISIDNSTLSTAMQHTMPVYYYNAEILHRETGKFNSDSFNEKSQIKLQIARTALQLGYTVLVSDLDIYFRVNPLPLIACNKSCDFAIQDNCRSPDKVMMNTGFIYLKSNNRTIAFYDAIMKRIRKNKDFRRDDQVIFNAVFQWEKRQGLQREVLPFRKFCVGKPGLDIDPKECVVYHANWISGVDKKKQRLKRLGMWEVERKECRS